MAAAIILVPEMLSGPRSRRRTRSRRRSRAAMRRSRLHDRPRASRRARSRRRPSSTIAHRRPRNVRPAQPPASRHGHNPLPAIRQSLRCPQQSAATAPRHPNRVRSEPAKPVVEPPTEPAPSASRTPASSCFGRRLPQHPAGGQCSSAASRRKQRPSDWRSSCAIRGCSAFVMPVKSGGATLYRVRVGPLQDRASAEAALRDVKSRRRRDRRASVTIPEFGASVR